MDDSASKHRSWYFEILDYFENNIYILYIGPSIILIWFERLGYCNFVSLTYEHIRLTNFRHKINTIFWILYFDVAEVRIKTYGIRFWWITECMSYEKADQSEENNDLSEVKK